MMKPPKKKNPEKKTPASENKKSNRNLFVVLALVAAVGLWQANEHGLIGESKTNQTPKEIPPQAKEPAPVTKTAPAIEQPKSAATVTLMILPRYLNVSAPNNLIIRKGTDLTELTSRLEKELSSETLPLKVVVDATFALKKDDYSDMKQTFVMAGPSLVLRLAKRRGPLEPLATFSPNGTSNCHSESAVVVKSTSAINSIVDLKDKKVLVEGFAEGPPLNFLKFTGDLNNEAKGIYSNIAFNLDGNALAENLKNDTADALFLSVDSIYNEGTFTILGKVDDKNHITGHEDFKVLHTTNYRIPCGFLMATSDLSPAIKDELLKNLYKFLQTPGNKDFLDQNIGIKSFPATNAETWTKATEFMQANHVETPTGQITMEKIKTSTK